MGGKIRLKEECKSIRDMLFFSTTNSAIDSLETNGLMKRGVLKSFSKSQVMLVTTNTDKTGKEYFKIHTPSGVYSCIQKKDRNPNMEYLLMTGFAPNSFASQNDAIKKGVSFAMHGGICISVKDKRSNLFCEYVNGSVRATTEWSGYSSNAVQTIRDALTTKTKPNKPDTRQLPKPREEYKPTDQLESFLTIAEGYAELLNELEENKVISEGRLVYTEIRSTDYERTDRPAYRFIVERFDDKVFAVKTQVEIKDRNDKTQNAEIIASGKDQREACYVDLLFNKQIDIESIEKKGFISLSFSTVIRDVQVKAIENIRDGTAPSSKYMDVVLGQFKSAGFDETDLTHLIKHYQDKTVPQGVR